MVENSPSPNTFNQQASNLTCLASTDYTPLYETVCIEFLISYRMTIPTRGGTVVERRTTTLKVQGSNPGGVAKQNMSKQLSTCDLLRVR